MNKTIFFNSNLRAVRLLLTVLLCLPMWASSIQAQTSESYAVFDAANGVLTFKHDAAKPSGAYSLITGDDGPQWLSERENIKKVVFDASFANARPTSCVVWFYECENLTEIEGIENLNTSNVTYMGSMFSGCSGLTTIYADDKFVTTKVESSDEMFFGCTTLKGAIAYDETKTDHRYANYIDGYFTKKDPATIESLIYTGDEKTEYFDLQGRRICEMQRGINIVRRGNKTFKVFVK